MKENLYSYVNLFLAMAISGSAVVVNKIMVNTIPAFLATELGLFFGLIVLLFLVFVVKKESYKLDKRTIFILIIQGFLGIVLYRIFTFYGLKYTSAAESGLITSSSPAIVCILAYFILKEKINKQSIVGLLFIIGGLFCINYYTYISSNNVYSSLFGNILIFLAVICEGFFSIISKIKCKNMSPLYRTTILVFCAFILLLPFAINDLRTYDVFSMPSKTKISILYYGFFVTYLSYVFWFKGIEKVKANVAAMFTSVVPISSILLSYVILNEKISLFHLFGMILIVIGILISAINMKK